MIWSKEETLSRQEIEEIQLARLKQTVSMVWEKVPPYRKKMEEAGVRPEHIQSLKDLAKLPFVTKQDMRDNYPFGLFAVPKDELVRIQAIQEEIWICGRNACPELLLWAAHRSRMLHRFVLATECLPELWDCTMGWKT